MDGRTITLRAHHGLCIRYFKGKGYSVDFTRHMAGVIAKLGPKTQVSLICAPDDICAGCPNLSCGECSSQSKVTRYDSAVLELCGIDEGASMPYGRFAELVEKNILAPGKRSEVCSDCEWNDICR